MPTVNEISHEAPPLGRSEQTPREFDILDVALIFAAHKWTILIASAAGFVIALLLVLVVTPTFTAKAVILPPQPDSRPPRLCSANLVRWLPWAEWVVRSKNPTDLYIGMLGEPKRDGCHGQAI